ncbi:DUF4194 domain-containing protein [Hazenella coriacea]|uniref:Uncharacterized protein DUF4194 n=1 Tax=Hazenella coriacea TaxID=1179467 RepID=A0A4R3L7I9_9BACL|nr:DUF4194 domain-containing protein [Hazenella coriacea]TCS95733.1 uncharacterized protein DUF4194 [Hazenella coriacea]
MFGAISEQEQERLKDIINQLLSVNFLLKELDREHFFTVRRYQEFLTNYFRFLGWDLVLDERHECVFLNSPKIEHRRRLSREESIWLLVLRLIYQEKRQGLSLSEFPVTNLYEIRTKYQTFQLEFVKRTQLKHLISLCRKYNLIDILDSDMKSDDCRIVLYHTFLHVIETEQLKVLSEKIKRYSSEKEDVDHEVAQEVEVD